MKYEIQIPRGATPDSVGQLVADVLQHHRVRSLSISPRGEVSVDLSLSDGQVPTPPETSPESSLIDLCRHVPVVEFSGPVGSLRLLHLLSACAQEQYLPLGWVCCEVPKDAVPPGENPLRVDFWLAGHRGYLDAQTPEGTLLLFAGWEQGSMRSVQKVYRIQMGDTHGG